MIAEFLLNIFLENIAITADGTFFINSYEEAKIYQVTHAVSE